MNVFTARGHALMSFPTLHRLFFALVPPQSAAAYLRETCPMPGGGRRVGADRLHVTLAILDDWPVLPGELVAAMTAVGGLIAAEPFRIVFDELVGGRHAVVLKPSESLSALLRFQRLLAAALIRASVQLRRGWRFSPHLTLLYGDRPGFSTPVDALSWTVEEFVLIESLVGETRHVVRGRWPLRRRG